MLQLTTPRNIYDFLIYDPNFSRNIISRFYPITQEQLLNKRYILNWQLVLENPNISWRGKVREIVESKLLYQKTLFNTTENNTRNIQFLKEDVNSHSCEYCFKYPKYIIAKDRFSMYELSRCPNFRWNYKFLKLVKSSIEQGYIDPDAINFLGISPYFPWSLKVLKLFFDYWIYDLLEQNEYFAKFIIDQMVEKKLFDDIIIYIDSCFVKIHKDFLPVLNQEEYDDNNRVIESENIHESKDKTKLRVTNRKLIAISRRIKYNPARSDNYCSRAKLKMLINDNEGAVYDFSIAIKLEVNNATFYNNRALCYEKMGKHVKALDDFSKAIKIGPENGIIYANRGFTRDSLGDILGANKDFKKALELTPDMHIQHFNLGIALLNKGEYNEAIERFSKAIRLDPYYARAYFLRCKSKIRLNQRDAAMDDYIIACALDFDPYESGDLKRES